MNRPLIGITVNCDYRQHYYWLPVAYCRRIYQAGGVPLLLAPMEEEAAGKVLSPLRGLLLGGGGDISPLYLGEEPLPGLGEVDPERDRWDFALAREAIRRRLPVLGICRGLQVMNAVSGGSIIQHLEEEGLLQHEQLAPRCFPSHSVIIKPGSLLAAITGKGNMAVNSFHHQALKTPAPGFIVSAEAPDRIIEALERPAHPFCLGVQWHPEALEHPASGAIFVAFIKACRSQQGR